MSSSALEARPGSRPLAATPSIIRLALHPLEVILLALSLVGGSLNMSTNRAVSYVGFGLITLALLYACYLLIGRLLAGAKWPRELRPVVFWGCLLGWLYLITLMLHGQLSGILFSTGRLWLFLGFMLLVACVDWKAAYLQILAAWLGGWVVVLSVWWAAAGFPRGFKAYLVSGNGLGPFAALALFFLGLAWLMTSQRWPRLVYAGLSVLSLGLLWGSSARSAMLAVVIALLVYALWPWLSRRRLRMHLVWIVLLCIVASAYVIYPLVRTQPVYDQLQSLSLQLTSKNVYSGRDVMWILVLRKIQERPLLGYGPMAEPRKLFATDHRAYSTYLLIALQVGLIGLALFILLLNAIWNGFWSGRNHPAVRIAAAALVFIVVHDIFEAHFTQGNAALGILMWMSIGIGLAYSWQNREQGAIEPTDACPPLRTTRRPVAVAQSTSPEQLRGRGQPPG